MTQHAIINLKDSSWLDRQKVAGTCVASVLRKINQVILDKTPNVSLKDLEQIAVDEIVSFGCTPTFQGYNGFPGAICLSVNKQLVHGIPTSYILQEGDVVKFDVGATYEGVIADAAATAIYGEPKSSLHTELIRICKGALEAAIGVVQVGKQIGCIGNAIHKYVSSKSCFNVVTRYGGHGIDENTPHAPPFVANKAKTNEGIRIQPGLTIAIEPMVVIGGTTTRVASDGWTVLTSDIGAHFEASIYVDSDKVQILTNW